MDVSVGSTVETANVTEVVKPKGRGGPKKAPAEANLFQLKNHSEVIETEAPKAQKKEPGRRAAAKKKSVSSSFDVSDDEDEIDISDDDEFEFEPVVAVVGKERRKVTATAKAAAAAKPPTEKRSCCQ